MNDLLIKLNKVVNLAQSSKLARLLNNPFKYLYIVIYNFIIYPITKKGVLKETNTFFEAKMQVLLPAGTDIYLTGGKSHDSELRLTKFIIKNLKENDVFIDVGAHLGFFTLLASRIIGSEGKVLAFEASQGTFSILKENISSHSNIQANNVAVSEHKGSLSFYEFPVLYSEYNSLHIEQFENTRWFKNNAPKKNEIEASSLDLLINNNSIVPSFIKIDVEGAENEVLKGAENLLKSYGPIVAMEYLIPQRENTEHQKAVILLSSFGYNTFVINFNGELIPIENIDAYLIENNLKSDNLVFVKN